MDNRWGGGISGSLLLLWLRVLSSRRTAPFFCSVGRSMLNVKCNFDQRVVFVLAVSTMIVVVQANGVVGVCSFRLYYDSGRPG